MEFPCVFKCARVAGLWTGKLSMKKLRLRFRGEQMVRKILLVPAYRLVKISLCLFRLVSWNRILNYIVFGNSPLRFSIIQCKNTRSWNLLNFNHNNRKQYHRKFYIKTWNENFRCKVKIPLYRIKRGYRNLLWLQNKRIRTNSLFKLQSEFEIKAVNFGDFQVKAVE